MNEIVFCPVDHNEMQGKDDNINTSYKCVDCSGYLIVFNQAIKSGLTPSELKPASAASFAILDCPLCKTVMLEYHYKDAVIDICFDCDAVWLDPCELTTILGSFPTEKNSLLSEFDQQLADGVLETPFILPYPDDYLLAKVKNRFLKK